jgi:hypothetical protein
MKFLSLTAVVYAALWVLNVLYGNFVLIAIQGLVGAGLFVALAVYLNTLDDENLTSHVKLDAEIKRLNEEIENLKNNKKTQNNP